MHSRIFSSCQNTKMRLQARFLMAVALAGCAGSALADESMPIKAGSEAAVTWVSSTEAAFANPDGSMVVVMGNASKQAHPITLTVAGRSNGDTIEATLAPHSINTFVVAPQKPE